MGLRRETPPADINGKESSASSGDPKRETWSRAEGRTERQTPKSQERQAIPQTKKKRRKNWKKRAQDDWLLVEVQGKGWQRNARVHIKPQTRGQQMKKIEQDCRLWHAKMQNWVRQGKRGVQIWQGQCHEQNNPCHHGAGPTYPQNAMHKTSNRFLQVLVLSTHLCFFHLLCTDISAFPPCCILYEAQAMIRWHARASKRSPDSQVCGLGALILKRFLKETSRRNDV